MSYIPHTPEDLREMLRAVGVESVRYVLYGAAWLGLIPAFFFWRASLRLNRELKSG